METLKPGFWAHCITLTTVIVFGLWIAVAPQALAGGKGKGKGQDDAWKQEKKDGKAYQKKERKMEHEARQHGEGQDREAGKTERKMEREEHKYGQAQGSGSRNAKKARKGEQDD
jgi:hypothetical protein